MSLLVILFSPLIVGLVAEVKLKRKHKYDCDNLPRLKYRLPYVKEI